MWDFIKKATPDAFSIKRELHSSLAGMEDPRPHFPLRASDLLSQTHEFCPREHAFLDLGVAKKKGQFIGTAQRMTFNHGKFMEDEIRNKHLRHLAVGHWVCSVCSKKHPTFGPVPMVKCSGCGYSNRWRYEEPRFEDPYTSVSGGLDMLAKTKTTKLKILEVKTIAPEKFKELVAPLSEHRSRTTLYMSLAEKSAVEHSERVDTKSAIILYVTKSFGFKDDTLKALGVKDSGFSPFKEFTIKRDDSILSTPLARARVLKVWREDQKGMPCGICSNGLTKRAQNCSAISSCFSGKYQSTLTWPELGKPKHPGKTVVE